MALTKLVISGSAWALGLRLANKLLGAIQLLILARLLVPEEFGLFAIASMTLLGFDVLTRTGFDDAIIYKRGNIDPYLHTAFIIQMARGLLLAGLVLVSSPYVAEFFNEPSAASVVSVLALVQVIKGFRSLGVVLFVRDINFRSEALYLTTGNFITVVATVLLAWELKNVWALVYGAIIGEIWLTVYSYFVHPYRPKLFFSVEKAKELIRFGVWLFLAGIVSYISLQADTIAVGKLLSTEMLGIYYMAFRISNLFVEEVSKPIGRVLQPAYATLQNKPQLLRLALEKAMSVFLMVITPIATLLIGGAWIIIPVVLGDRWTGVNEVFSILVLGALFRGFAGVSRGFFVGTGRPRSIFWLEAAQAASLLLTLYPLFLCCAMNGIAWASTLSSALKFSLVLLLLLPVIRTREFIKSEVVPIGMAICAMTGVLMVASAMLATTWGGLLTIVISSGVVYAAVLWVIAPKTAHIGIVKGMAVKGANVLYRSLRGGLQPRQ